MINPLVPVAVPLIALFVATVVSISHTAIYGWRYPWHSSDIGRSIFMLSLSISLALALTVSNLLTGFWKGQLIVDTVVYLFIALSMVFLIRTMFIPIRLKREPTVENTDGLSEDR